MSSEISTEAGPGKPTAAFEPWQLFTLAGLISAAIVAYFASAQPPAARIFLILTIFAAAAVGVGALRTLLPLTGGSLRERHASLSDRTRALLEREKALSLRSIKELDFDRAMGKVSEGDYHEMCARLRARAGRILRQLDAAGESPYRDAIELELARRLGTVAAALPAPEAPATPETAPAKTPPTTSAATSAATLPTAVVCATCSTTNEADARFCKECGARLEAV